MPNRNYIKGRRKEYKIIKELKAEGFHIAQRTAGSHSPIDVIAIDKIKKLIYLVQSKNLNKSNPRRLEKLYIEEKNLNGWYEVKFIIR